jgi:hypothetical protein
VSFKIWCLARTRPAPNRGLFLLFLLLNKVKHFIFEEKFSSLCEKDHLYVDEVGIVVPYDVHVVCS